MALTPPLFLINSLKNLKRWLCIKRDKIFVKYILFARYLIWLNTESKIKNTNPNGIKYFTKDDFPFVVDHELGVWNRPNHHFVKRTKIRVEPELVTNVYFDPNGIRVGNKNDEVKNQVDILVLGESNTWGQGVNYNETYAAIVGERLNMNVANLGLIGSNGVQSLLLLRRYLKFKPKLIIYGFWEEHLLSNIQRCPNIDSPVCLGRPIIKRFHRKTLQVSLPKGAKLALKQYVNWYRDSSLGTDLPLLRKWYWKIRLAFRVIAERHIDNLKRGSGYQKLNSSSKKWNYAIDASKYVVSEMKELADSVGAKLVIVYLPIFFMEEINSLPIELQAHMKNLDVIFVDMGPTWYTKKNNGENFYFTKDLHLNQKGHSDVSERIVSSLKSIIN